MTRYRRAGLIFAGRSSTPEFGILPTTEPALFGPTRNPWDLERTAGGSSGGSGAAVAAGISPIGHGGDGGGSLRIPASCCGLFGFKPTRGRTPAGPDASENWAGFAIEHALTRSVRDSAALLDVSAGEGETPFYYAPPKTGSYLEEVQRDPKPLRIAFTAKALLTGVVHKDCVKATYETADLCEKLGHHVEEASPEFDSEDFGLQFFKLVASEVSSLRAQGERVLGRLPKHGDLETTTWMLVLLGEHFSAAEAAAARRQLQVETRKILGFFQNYDVLLTPTLGKPPPRLGALVPQGLEALGQKAIVALKARVALNIPGAVRSAVSRVYEFIPFTPIANVTGQPAMSLPLHWNEAGLPIGTMFTGRFGDEATLFRLAGQLERERPWFDKRPPGFGA
jgi:amidase